MGEESKKRRTLTGKCNVCGGTFSKATMARHLQACLRKQTPGAKPSGKTPSKTLVFHLVVEDRYMSDYWMHLQMPASATLADLDAFLRQIWLECCGHLSAFKIGGQEYSSAPETDFGGFGDLGIPEDQSMDAALGSVLRPKMKFEHEYDFGTTTTLTLKVAAQRETAIAGQAAELLARNDPPEIPCESCGKPATEVCSQCVYSGDAWYCNKCARKHECDEEMFLPVVNSPRTGMCGYTG